MKTRTILLVFTIAWTGPHAVPAQKKTSGKEGYYQTEMKHLQAAIQKYFYDSAAGFYKEVISPGKEHNPYSYLWGVCTMFQAANEIEKIAPGARLLQPMLSIIEAYYDPKPPYPGYASYITKLKGGDRFYDDNEWIGITAMDAFVRTKNKNYLHLGKEIYKYMMTGYDTVLTGGLYWQENKKTSKNTCSNGPGIILALQLFKSVRQKSFLDTALMLYKWENSTLKSPAGLYYDNINIRNKRVGKAVYSYNTGTMLQSNLYLYECTKEKKYLSEAISIADSSLAFFYGNGSFKDNYWFNAVLLRGYQHLLQYHNDLKYVRGFKICLDNALRKEKNEEGLFAKNRVLDLVAHGGMLEMLARYAYMESRYQLE